MSWPQVSPQSASSGGPAPGEPGLQDAAASGITEARQFNCAATVSLGRVRSSSLLNRLTEKDVSPIFEVSVIPGVPTLSSSATTWLKKSGARLGMREVPWEG